MAVAAQINVRPLVHAVQVHFRKINRDCRLTKADKKQIKLFFLERVMAPQAQNLAKTAPAPASRPKNRLLTAAELEAWLSIDRKTIYHYVKRRAIPYIRIQSNVRFRRGEIAAWVRRHHKKTRKRRRKAA